MKGVCMMGRIIEDEHYYDNKYIIADDIIEFERVYMVDEDKFDDETYRQLGVVYKSLPAYVESPTYLPCWYGDEEKGDKYFISVSFEMSGLQFWGNLLLKDFLKWENIFNKLIEPFPFKYHE
ncbi:hypothetical protein [Clostridium tetani]|uniref:hypothetical protein n=1 Tax=Clostridium tetani TaxID=1513 RepID=UPI002953D28B|nr:hypothetical protein [Clostridium tetani]BDR76720.1 hypothetical protein K154306013_23800 [Clostridium tetani]